MLSFSHFFILTALIFCIKCAEVDVKSKKNSVLDNIIMQALESIRAPLENLAIKHLDFDSGNQEFGNLKGHVDNVTINGLETFTVPVLSTSLTSIKNLTILEKKFTMTGKYNINGSLVFPLGKSDIHLFGDGEMSAEFKNFFISMKLKFFLENGKREVKEFDILMGLENMKVYMKNLMGGGDLEKVFNSLINDVGLTVFNYYKQPILDTIKPEIKKIITDMLNPKHYISSPKDEL